MRDWKNVPILMFQSAGEYAARDLQAEQRVKDVIRKHVLEPSAKEYIRVNVAVKRRADQEPRYLAAYGLRKDIYKAEVVRIDLGRDFTVTQVTPDYKESEMERRKTSQRKEKYDFYFPPYERIEFVVSTPFPEIPSTKAAVEEIHRIATAAGLRAKILEGPEANWANYDKYLNAGLLGFVHIGYADQWGDILLADGQFWMDADHCNPEVIYFNSCKVFDTYRD